MCTYLDFPAPLIEEAVFSPLYILTLFCHRLGDLGPWVYVWAFYPEPVIFLCLCQYHTVLITVAF